MSNSDFDKPFIDFPDLVMLLNKRGLSIRNPMAAIDLLKIYGYYPVINGFKREFQVSTEDELYKDGTSLEQLMAEFILDSQFQEIFLTGVFPVENHFKNVIGYQVAKNFGVNNHQETDPTNPSPSMLSYLNPSHYVSTNSIKRSKTTKHIRDSVLQSDDNPVKYYREHHNHIPPWIMMQNMMLGEAVKYFQILPEDLKTAIVEEMIDPIPSENLDQKKALFLTSIEMLRQFRNAAAHSSPLYLVKDSQDNSISLKVLKKYLGNAILSMREKTKYPLSNLYGALLSLILLSRNPGQRSNLIEKLRQIESTYLSDENDLMYTTYNTYLKIAHLPKDYIKRLENAHLELQKHNHLHFEFESDDGTIKNGFDVNRHPVYDIAQERQVYISDNSTKYHFNSDCPAIRNIPTHQISLQRAKERGLTKCTRE